MRKKTFGAVSCLALAGGMVVVLPAPAEAASRGYGYVLAQKSGSRTGKAYKPSRSKNSTGRANTVVRTAKGRYTVRFPGLGRKAGIVHVSAYGRTQNSCTVVSWKPVKQRLDAKVQCVSPSGGRANTAFSLAYTDTAAGGGGNYGYLMSEETAASHTPSAAHRFNSAGGVNSVKFTGTGKYEVGFPGLGGTGHVQVTAYGAVKARCSVQGFGQSGGGALALISCADLDGDPRNTRFTVTYIDKIGLQRRKAAAYAFSSQTTPAVPFEVPDRLSYNSEADPITISQDETGFYRVEVPGQPLNKGNVQVSAVGNPDVYCHPVRWSEADDIVVHCLNGEGDDTDALFDVSYQL